MKIFHIVIGAAMKVMSLKILFVSRPGMRGPSPSRRYAPY